MQQLQKNIAFSLFLCTLFFAPLAFGTVEAWSMATVELLICVTALLYFFQGRKTTGVLLRAPGQLPLILLVSWMFFQLIPLPPFIVQVIAPEIYQTYEPILGLGNSGRWIPLTVMQKASVLEFLRISCYGLFYLLTVQLLGNRRRLTGTVHCVAFLAIAIAFLAIIQKFTSPDAIYWFRPTPDRAGTVGPWVYHNHYAGFMEMLIPLVLALFFYYRPKIRYEETLRARIAALFTMPSSNLHFFFGFGVIVMVSSVFIALSRGGVISMCLALLLFVVLQIRKKCGANVLLVVVICFALLAVSWFGWDPLVAKFSKTVTVSGGIEDGRLNVWKDSGSIMRDFLFTGSGFGTFIHVYPQYRTAPGTLIYDHAHNDYIELLTDGGLIGFCLDAWFVLAVLVHGWKRIQQRRDPYAILISIGALTGIVSILFHSVTDFNMHNGANGLYFFFLCGLLVSAGNTRLHYRTRPTLLPYIGAKKTLIFPLTALCILGSVLYMSTGRLLGERSYRQVSSMYLSQNLRKEKLYQVQEAVSRASRYDPLEGLYPSILGNVAYYLQQEEESLCKYTQAVRLDPLNGRYLQRLGLLLSVTAPEQGRALLELAYARAIDKEKIVLTWAEWLLRTGQRQKAILVMQTGLARYPKLVPSAFPLLAAYSFTREEILRLLPKSTGPWIRLGAFMDKRGELEESEYYREHALDYLGREQKIRPWFFNQLYRFYQRQKDTEKAMAVLRKAIEILPDHAPFHVSLGNYYLKKGVEYRAREEYEQALMLEPGNAKVRKKLEQLQE